MALTWIKKSDRYCWNNFNQSSYTLFLCYLFPNNPSSLLCFHCQNSQTQASPTIPAATSISTARIAQKASQTTRDAQTSQQPKPDTPSSQTKLSRTSPNSYPKCPNRHSEQLLELAQNNLIQPPEISSLNHRNAQTPRIAQKQTTYTIPSL